MIKDNIKNLIIKDYLLGDSSVDNLSLKYDIERHTIYKIFKRNSISIRQWRKYTLDESFFDKIDMAEKAYLFGLISSDGYIITRNLVPIGFNIVLHKKDREHLESVKKLLKSDQIIYNSKLQESSTLFINSKKICQALLNLGLIPNKSRVLEYPKFLDKRLFNSYLLGMSDGDGSWYITKKDNKPHWKLTSGCYKYLEDIREILTNSLNLPFNKIIIQNDPRSFGISYFICYSGIENCRKVYNLIYKNASIYLPRKKLVVSKYFDDCEI